MTVESFILLFLIIGAPSIGMEALQLGIGGELKNRYGKWFQRYGISSLVGLIIVGVVVLVTKLFSLKPMFSVALTFLLIIIFGSLLSLVQFESNEFPKDDPASGKEIKEILKNRGLNSLMKENESKQKGE